MRYLSPTELLERLDHVLSTIDAGSKGIFDLNQVFEFLEDFGLENHHVEFDLTLARGLSYYTGTILEVRVNNASITSSVTGGGRYDNLTGVFGLEGISGVGFSFGVDRIFDVMEELDLFPKQFGSATKVLVLNFDPASMKAGLKALTALRKAGIKSEIYPDQTKIKKQMNYANKKSVPFVLMIGENEIKEGKYQLKNMETGEQRQMELAEILTFLGES